MWQKLKSWVKSKIREYLNKLRRWANQSRVFLAIVCLTIGATGMFVWEHQEDFQILKSVRIEIAGEAVQVTEAYQGESVKADSYQVTGQPAPKNANSGEIGSTESSQSIVLLIQRYFGDEWKVAYAVMMAESSGKAEVIGDRHLAKPSVGLFQINQIWHPYTTEQLQDPEFNIKIAKEIRDSGGWNRWTTYRTGAYEQFLNS